MDAHREITLNLLEKEVRDSLLLVDEIKLGVSADEKNDYKQYFVGKGFDVTTGTKLLPPPFVKLDYYILIRGKK